MIQSWGPVGATEILKFCVCKAMYSEVEGGEEEGVTHGVSEGAGVGGVKGGNKVLTQHKQGA